MAKQQIGALWVKQVKDKIIYSGTIEVNGEKVKINIWPNDYKSESKHPDMKIYIDDYVKGAYDDRINKFINAARGRDENGINNDEVNDLPF